MSELPEFVRSVLSSIGGTAVGAPDSIRSCTAASGLIGIPLSVSLSVRVITEGLEGFSLDRVANSTRPPEHQHGLANQAGFEGLADRNTLFHERLQSRWRLGYLGHVRSSPVLPNLAINCREQTCCCILHHTRS